LVARAGRRAFTLVELLVVISIVSLLMAILLTTLTRVRKAARAAACLSNVRQWGITCYARAADEGGVILSSYGLPWWSEVRSYGKDMLLCPEAVKPAPCPFVARKPDEAWSTHPYDPGGEVACGYGVNAWVRETDTVRPKADAYGWWGNPLFEDFMAKHWFWSGRALRTAGRVPLLFDCITSGGYPEGTDEPPAFHGDFSIVELGGATFNRQSDHMRWVCMDRHGGGRVSMTFVDGSSRLVGLKELWTLDWHREYDTTGPWTKAGGVLASDWPGWMRGFRDY
jgi:prepilin-type N-terminal cleavage/methylation domain-containing protein/prepilin-type processing-associated H-X9-DG protein